MFAVDLRDPFRPVVLRPRGRGGNDGVVGAGAVHYGDAGGTGDVDGVEGDGGADVVGRNG